MDHSGECLIIPQSIVPVLESGAADWIVDGAKSVGRISGVGEKTWKEENWVHSGDARLTVDKKNELKRPQHDSGPLESKRFRYDTEMSEEDFFLPLDEEGQVEEDFFLPLDEEGQVDIWLQMYRKKEAEECNRSCERCPLSCILCHPEDVPCPPCPCRGYIRSFGVLSSWTTNRTGSVELSLAYNTSKYPAVEQQLTSSTFMLAGQPCNVVVAVEINGRHCVVSELSNKWRSTFGWLPSWVFERHGFEDAAIAELFSRAYEDTCDDLEAHKRGMTSIIGSSSIITVPLQEVSPTDKVVLVATWNGRVKIAGRCSLPLLMFGDYKLGRDEKLLDVLNYGKAEAQVPLREGNVSGKITLMMVSKNVEPDLSSLAKHDDDVEKMAQALLEYEGVDLAWVAQIHTDKPL